MKCFYVAPVVRTWKSITVLGMPIQAHDDPHCVGFLPVFDTREGAESWCKEHNADAGGIIEIEEAPKAAKT